MFIKTGGSSGTSNSSNGCSNCNRTRIFIAGEMSRSDRALDDARRCSADRRSSELDGNVNERAAPCAPAIVSASSNFYLAQKIFPSPRPSVPSEFQSRRAHLFPRRETLSRGVQRRANTRMEGFGAARHPGFEFERGC